MNFTHRLLRFEPFELNLDTGVLRKHGTPLKLSPQPFAILALLAGRSGQIVTRAEIQGEVWGEATYVDFEHGLNQCIKQIRTVLNDNPERPVYVETVPRRGYRFLAPVRSKTVVAPAPQVEKSTSVVQVAPVMEHPTPVPVVAAKLPASDGAGAAAAAAATAVAPALEQAPGHPVKRRRLLVRVAGAAALVGVSVAGWVYWSSRKVEALTEKDTIVLADFTNTTGDSTFDGTLRQAMAYQLEQSPFLNILSDQKVRAALQRMQKPVDQVLTPQVATEVCLRTSSRAVLTGSIASAGGGYQIGLRALRCDTGNAFAVVQVEARRNEVLAAVGRAGDEMRVKMGESLASLKRFDQPLVEATTPSLEALQALSKTKRFGSPTENIPYVKRAIELDPNFAIAYLELGGAYVNVGEPSLGAQNIKRAYELRERASQRERFYIEAFYYTLVTHDLESGERSFREWALDYPNDWRPHNDLAIVYAQLGRPDDAAREMRQVIRLTPDNPGAYANLMGMLTAGGHLDDARASYQEAQRRNLDSPYLGQYKYNLSFLDGDAAGMQEQAEWARGKPRSEDVLLSAQSDTEAYYGRVKNARALSSQAAQSALGADAREAAAGWIANEALREAELGDYVLARKVAVQALSLDQGRDVRIVTALALARAGDVAMAEKLAGDLSQEFPSDTILQNYSLPAIRAAIQLQQTKPLAAVETLEVTRPYELGQGSIGWLYPAYLRGEAYLMAGQSQKAAAEFQKLRDHRGLVANFVLGPLGLVQLGRAQVMMGNKDAARAFYEEFFKFWKDGDPDIPLYRRAKAEYARIG